jgi:type IV pilus assembly protein PilB
MIDMEVPSYLVATSVIAVLAQRLVRKVCERCKVTIPLSEAVLQDAGISQKTASTATFVKGRGCTYCSKKGFRGRLGIYELMHVNSKIREMIFKQQSSTEIRKVAIEQGMRTLYNDGIWKTIRGITTLEEVYKNAKRTEQDGIV